MNKKIKKCFIIIVCIAFGIFLLSFVFNKYFWNSIIMNTKMKLYMRNIAKEEQKYAKDTYGGKTPEETYSMFLDALKKKDIELASKYFVLNKQDQYKKALSEVDQNGKWDLMMEDLTQKNLIWRKNGETSYTLEIMDEDNEFLTQISFLLPTKTFDNNSIISSFWKIYSF